MGRHGFILLNEHKNCNTIMVLFWFDSLNWLYIRLNEEKKFIRVDSIRYL